MTGVIENQPADRIMLDPDVIEFICRENGILRLYLVGSAARDDRTPLSDLDFLVTFGTMERPLEQYFAAKYAFEKAFDRKVDLIMENAVKNPHIRHSLDADKQLLYERDLAAYRADLFTAAGARRPDHRTARDERPLLPIPLRAKS
jgi:uncharacterized protein